MNISKQKPPSTEHQALKRFLVCRLNLSSGDEHVGMIASHRFIGNKLLLQVAPMVRIAYFEKDQQKVPMTFDRHSQYALTFDGCTIVKDQTNGQMTTVKSFNGDVVVMSNDPKDIAEIELHLNENNVPA
jgi:hypothetical protein